jgi:hypothetical protein
MAEPKLQREKQLDRLEKAVKLIASRMRISNDVEKILNGEEDDSNASR